MARGLAQPLEGIKALGAAAGGAIILWIVITFKGELLVDARASAPGGSGGVVANQWLTTGVEVVLPLLFLLLIFFGLIAQAVLNRRYT
jgi:hypothetical protein